MQVLRRAFSFKGVLDRRGFAIGHSLAFAALMALGVAVFVPAYLTLMAFGTSGRIGPATFAALQRLAVPLIVMIFALPYIWVLAALAAKRARSMGANPIAVVAAWVLMAPLDALVFERLTTARFVAPFQGMTPIGGAASAILLILLLVWPPRTAASPALPSRRAAYPADQSRTGFGLRG